MPSIAAARASPMPTVNGDVSSPHKRRLRSNSASFDDPVCNTPLKSCSPLKSKSPRRSVDDTPNRNRSNVETGVSLSKLKNSPKKKLLGSFSDKPIWNPTDSEQSSAVKEALHVSPLKSKSPRRSVGDSPNRSRSNVETGVSLLKLKSSPKKKLLDSILDKPIWNPTDSEQLSAVKEALHVSTAPAMIVCREDEQKRIVEFCKQCVEQEKAGSLYVCGCPGTGKSLSMENVKGCLAGWAKETGGQLPDILAINCTSLSNTSEIFNKILEKSKPNKKINGRSTALKQLQQLFSQKQQSADTKMMLVIADELDYLITKDRVVLHDLFMLTTLPFSKVILIGIANAIDLADRFLPKLQSLNCKPAVVSFRAYSMDQIIMILKQRLMALPYTVFQPQALELCARKVAAASGDMRKALGICRGAIEMLETELRESTCTSTMTSMVRVDHMAIALSRAYKSPIVDTIQSLPQHQQIVLCSVVKLFRKGKKDTTIGELNKFYIDICKSTLIPPVGIMELSCMCRVLGDQGILKLGQSRDDKLRRVTLQVDEADISFALQGIRFFRNCLQ
ncbi:putative Cell division protein Cdc6/18 [Helianthus annuus]|nr:putative Cell division protein Cdc6/18 [Helianthus annuus]